jgi:signal transduction histidine kinase
VVVPSDRRELFARFEAVDLASGRALRFEHRLEGADGGWSAPEPGSTVSYAGLARGRYALSMRAIAPDGRRSAAATVRFEVLAPWWQRPWAVALGLLGVAAAGALAHRARVARTLALERMRTQIATDLHDDAGANLAQIAILAEVARQGAPAGDASLLTDVAELARATRRSIADLVWAVDPRRDTLLDLVQRVRGVATNLFESGARLDFRAPPSEALAAIELDPSARRHLLFLLQEALNNASRHAGARAVEVAFELAPGRLRVRLHDDGRGFDPGAPTEGHGLASMRRRARSMGAAFSLESAAGRGTTLDLDVPLERRPRILVRWRRAGRRGRIEG